jgi:hypothetical protein
MATQVLTRGAFPATKVMLPLAGAIFGALRGDEPGEDGALAIALDDRFDRRQHLVHPGRRPETIARKDVLHVDAKVRGVDDFLHGRFLPRLRRRTPQAR